MRSGLEALVTLLYITQQDSEERATLYAGFDHMLAEAYAVRVDQWPDLFKGVANLAERRHEIKKNFERVKADYPIKDFWAGKLIKSGKLRQMAKEVGLKWYYDFMYWFGSNHVHANVRSAYDLMHVSDDKKFHFNFAPSATNTKHALLLATDFLIRAFACIVEFFELPEEDRVKTHTGAYAAIYKDIKAN